MTLHRKLYMVGTWLTVWKKAKKMWDTLVKTTEPVFNRSLSLVGLKKGQKY